MMISRRPKRRVERKRARTQESEAYGNCQEEGSPKLGREEIRGIRVKPGGHCVQREEGSRLESGSLPAERT